MEPGSRFHESSEDAMHNVPVWETGERTNYAPLTHDATADIVVIGLGGSGLAAVLAARARGYSVIGIDAAAVAAGAAGRNGGFLLQGTAAFYHDARAAIGHDRARALYDITGQELRRIAAETPDSVRITGSLRIAWSDAELDDCDVQYEALREDGFAVEHYVGSEGKGLLFPGDGVYQPLARCRTLAAMAVAAGAGLHEGTYATDIAGDEVRTPHGSIRCNAVIAAVDGGLRAMFPELSSRVRTARLQMLATAPERDVHFPRPVYARYGYEYWQQLPDGRITLGGFRDRYAQDEWTDADTPSPEIQDLLERHLRDVLHVSAPIEHRWAASVGYTDNELPIFEEVRPGVWAIGGYSGTGNVIGAACGRAAVECVSGGDPQIARLLNATTGPA